MKAIIALLLLLSTLIGCGGYDASVKQPSQYLQNLGNQTVAFVNIYPNGEVRPFCTGVWIKKDMILTASHCITSYVEHLNKVKEDDSPEIKNIGAKMHYVFENEVAGVSLEPTAIHLAKSFAIDPTHDLGLVKTEGVAVPNHQSVELADAAPAIGEKLEIIGHPHGLYWTYVEGTVSANRTTYPTGVEDKKGPYMQVSAGVWFGNSGGGAFDSDGKLVGISSFLIPTSPFDQHSGMPHQGFYIHLDSIKAFLKKNKI